jgi:hypothetical protein
VLSPLRSFFFENRKQRQWHYKEHQGKQSEQEVIHRSLVVENHVSGKDELVVSCSIIVRSFGIRVVIPKLRTYGYEHVRLPGDADGMLRIIGGEASPAANLVFKIFVSHGEEGTGRNTKHRVVHHRPFRRIAISHWE